MSPKTIAQRTCSLEKKKVIYINNGNDFPTQTVSTMLGQMQTTRPCSACGGKGQIIKEPCPDCRGKGKIRKSVKITVKIPEGVDEGQTIVARGQGEPGINGGPNGDLYVEFTVRDHDFFEREEDDIYIELPLTITEAVLGTKKEVPTLYGNVDLTIPSGTQSGDKMRLRGKGVENVNTKRKGDMYVITKVIIPEKLTKEQKKLFEQLKETPLDNSKEFKTYKNCIK